MTQSIGYKLAFILVGGIGSLLTFLVTVYFANFATHASVDKKLNIFKYEKNKELSVVRANQQSLATGLCIINEKACKIKIK